MLVSSSSFFFFFGGTGVGTQRLALARQAIYHSNHASSPMLFLLQQPEQTKTHIFKLRHILNALFSSGIGVQPGKAVLARGLQSVFLYMNSKNS
jgi:hypothetical protein